jgi:hypothetical protein
VDNSVDKYPRISLDTIGVVKYHMDMPINRRTKDPRQIPVQLNVSIPWAFREYLSEKAAAERTSLNKLCVDVLFKAFGEGFTAAEARGTRTETKSVTTS